MPPTVALPAVCVKLKLLPPTSNMVPVETVKVPALVKLPPVVVSEAPEASLKIPVERLLLNPARMLLWPKSIISPVPFKVMFAALVAMVVPLAPNCSCR